MKRRLILFGLLALLLLPATAAQAAPVFNRTVVAAGETLNEDISLFGEELTIEAGATVNGDVTVIGGNADIAGTINGNFSMLGGNVTLAGPVRGDIAVLGGNLVVEAGTMVDGDCFTLGGNLTNRSEGGVRCSQSGALPWTVINGVFSRPEGAPEGAPGTGAAAQVGAGARSAIGLIGWSLFLTGIAWALATVWPRQLARTRHAVRERPLTSSVVGLLTAAAFASLSGILALISTLLIIACFIGLLGYPLLVAMAGLFGLAVVHGWVAIGSLLGERLLRTVTLKGNRDVNAAVLGTLVQTFGLGLLLQLPAIVILPVLAGMVGFVLVCAGLGAATLTRLGRRPFPAELVDAGKVDDVLATLSKP